MSFWDDMVSAVVDPFGIGGMVSDALGGGDKKADKKDDGGGWWDSIFGGDDKKGADKKDAGGGWFDDIFGTDEDKIRADKKGGGGGFGTDEMAIMKSLKAEPAGKMDMIRESFSMKDMGGDFFEKKGGMADMGKSMLSGALGGAAGGLTNKKVKK